MLYKKKLAIGSILGAAVLAGILMTSIPSTFTAVAEDQTQPPDIKTLIVN